LTSRRSSKRYFLDLAKGSGAPLPVTEAARDAYRQVVQDGWDTHDITALVEYRQRSA
jgi:3-hydroxyisobutyrate dehydrogenase-like beta-hydroxyacid dehydrogenase